jgi:hypothetical protein
VFLESKVSSSPTLFIVTYEAMVAEVVGLKAPEPHAQWGSGARNSREGLEARSAADALKLQKQTPLDAAPCRKRLKSGNAKRVCARRAVAYAATSTFDLAGRPGCSLRRLAGEGPSSVTPPHCTGLFLQFPATQLLNVEKYK